MDVQTVAPAKDADALSPRQQEFVDVAVKLFHERGYPSTSIYDIGAATGLSGAALYRHFRNKEDILIAAVRQFAATVESATSTAIAESPGEPNATLEAVLRALVDITIHLPDALAVYKVEARHLPEPIREDLAMRETALRERWAGIVMRARPDLNPDEATARTDAAILLAGQVSPKKSHALMAGNGHRLTEYALRVLLSDG